MNSLSGLALVPLLDGRLKFTPARYADTYRSWLENLRDWPISRQLWWGHRIPVWHFTLKAKADYSEAVERLTDLLHKLGLVGNIWTYRKKENLYDIYVCLENTKDENLLDALSAYSTQLANSAQAYAPGEILKSRQPIPSQISKDTRQAFDFLRDYVVTIISRDEDVLDTWFSSALWPFSTLGWPEEKDELKRFYPGDVLCTAREIITLWVSRMVMMGQYCVGDIPFRDVYIHAMIQDGEGRKMSKSLGNGIDPLVAIDSHGADAMRFTLASMTTQTQDVRMPVEKMTLPDGREANTSPKFDIGRNFCNKLWNASRFCLMNLDGIDPAKFDKDKLTITDKWILSRLAQTIEATTTGLDEYKFSEPLGELYKFFWNDFCDWYLEWAKPRIQDETDKPIAQNVLAFVLDRILRLLHPFVPFITEGLYGKLNEIAPARGLCGIAEGRVEGAIVTADWPANMPELVDEDTEQKIGLVQSVIRTIRDIRNNRNIAPGKLLVVSAKSQKENVEVLNPNSALIRQLAGVSEFKAAAEIEKPATAAVGITEAAEVYVHDAIDIKAEQKRLEKQKKQIERAKEATEAKLSNKNFIKKAKQEVVERAKERLGELTEQLKTIERHLEELDG
jgi:valyl-tRNA synthetase